MHTIYFKRSGS